MALSEERSASAQTMDGELVTSSHVDDFTETLKRYADKCDESETKIKEVRARHKAEMEETRMKCSDAMTDILNLKNYVRDLVQEHDKARFKSEVDRRQTENVHADELKKIQASHKAELRKVREEMKLFRAPQ